MDASQYRGNSIASRQHDIPEEPQREKIERVTTGKKVPQSAGRKFLSEFIADDVHTIKDYILWDVLLPAVKNAISDTVTNGVDMLLFGQTRARGNNVKRITPYSSLYSNGSSNRVVKYNDMSQEQRRQNRGLGGYSYQEVVLPTRPEAEDVLAHMRLYLDRWQVVSVADLYDAVGEVPEMIDNKWGWTDLSTASVQRCSEGFILRMPRVESI
jgi:hypothetical protein